MSSRRKPDVFQTPNVAAHLREAFALLRRERVLTATVGLVVLGMVVGILATAGQTDAAARSVLSRIDTPSARAIVITDVNGQAGLDGASIAALQTLSGIDWVLGLGPGQDVRNALIPSSSPVPMRTASGDVRAALGVDLARLSVGSALASTSGAARLGLSQGVGAARTTDLAEYVIAGTYRPPPWLAPLQESVLRPATDAGEGPATIIVLAASISSVSALIQAARAVVVAEDPAAVSVTGSTVLSDLQRVVSGELAGSSYAIVLGVLAVGAFATAVTLIGLLGLRSVDFGRRRALGASRGQLLAITLLHVAYAGILGALCGVAASVAALAVLIGQLPGISFIAGASTISILTAIAAATLPAVRAAAKDPVAVVRTP